MDVDRRTFLQLTGAGATMAGRLRTGSPREVIGPPDSTRRYTLRIAAGLVEVAPNRVLSTTLYNNQFPGPLLRLREGRPVVIDVFNDTDVPEQIHWHGLSVPVDVDGSTEEGTPAIPPHGHRQLNFVPGPSGSALLPYPCVRRIRPSRGPVRRPGRPRSI